MKKLGLKAGDASLKLLRELAFNSVSVELQESDYEAIDLSNATVMKLCASDSATFIVVPLWYQYRFRQNGTNPYCQ